MSIRADQIRRERPGDRGATALGDQLGDRLGMDLGELRAAFARDGYVLLRGLLREEGSLARVRDQIQSAIEIKWKAEGLPGLPPTEPDRSILRLCEADRRHGGSVYRLGRRLSEVRRLSVHPLLLDLSQALMGSDRIAVNTLAALRMDLPQEDGYLFRWHQDYPYAHGSLDGLTYWVPLHDVPVERGCLRILPGSHRCLLPVRVIDPENVRANGARSLEFDTTGVDLAGAIDVPVCYGDVLVISTLLVHRSQPNLADRCRWTVQIRHDNFAHPEAVRLDWPGGMLEGRRIDEMHPQMALRGEGREGAAGGTVPPADRRGPRGGR